MLKEELSEKTLKLIEYVSWSGPIYDDDSNPTYISNYGHSFTLSQLKRGGYKKF